MQIMHESGRKFKHDGIIEVDSCNNPVRVLLKTGEVRKIYKSGEKYWFTYNSNKFFLEDLNLKHEKITIELHIKRCLSCARLQMAENRCLNPEGLCSFKGHTKQFCIYFKAKPEHGAAQ